jgi:predicted Zn-dependent protease
MLYAQNRLPEAEQTLLQLRAVNPDYARGWRWMRDVKQRQGKVKEADECNKHAIELDPDDVF